MKQNRPFVPITDELCTILDVDRPGDLPKVVIDLKIRNMIYLDALSEFPDCVQAVRDAIAKFKEVKDE